jgi:hypothetical protein
MKIGLLSILSHPSLFHLALFVLCRSAPVWFPVIQEEIQGLSLSRVAPTIVGIHHPFAQEWLLATPRRDEFVYQLQILYSAVPQTSGFLQSDDKKPQLLCRFGERFVPRRRVLGHISFHFLCCRIFVRESDGYHREFCILDKDKIVVSKTPLVK